MSVSSAQAAVKRAGSELARVRTRHSAAVKDVNKLQTEANRLEGRAAKASSDSLRRSYLSQLKTKSGQLERARNKVTGLVNDVTKAENKLTDAEQKLREAEIKEREQETKKKERERRQREQRERSERQRQASEARRRKRQEESAERNRAAEEANRDRVIDVLAHRTTELEARLAEAERRSAPSEVTVLFLASSPEDQPALRLDRETREIQKRIRTADFRDSIWVEWRLARQLPDLLQDLNEIGPDILHFSGHGSDAELAFEDEDGTTRSLGNEQLKRLLEAAGSGIRLIVFNSCDSAAQAEIAIQQVDLAIGMDAAIDDEAAKVFAGQFYNTLGFGKSVGEAFRQATFQIEAEAIEGDQVPQLFAADGADPEVVVLVNPDASSTARGRVRTD